MVRNWLPEVAWSALMSVLIISPLYAQDMAERNRRIYQEAVADPTNIAKITAFIATLVEAPRGAGKYIVEGDLLLSRSEIESYLKRLKSPNSPQVSSEELIVNVTGGRFDYLRDPKQRQMAYIVEASNFPSDQAAQQARVNFRRAADDWEAVCPKCGVRFVEASAADVSSGKVHPYFVVRYENVEGGPIARAFFPSSAPDDRSLVVFPAYFTADLGFDRVGVMRHEIGHILGYRHEHIRNIPGCYTEGSDWSPLTPYTPNSVMHYFCGGRGSFDLTIRETDRRGHRCLYLTGKPCPPK